MTDLAHRLGVSKELAFHDVYSLYDPDVMAMVPRPVFALLITTPISEPWRRSRQAEDAPLDWYKGAGPDEPVVWFQQTVIHGCGLIGLLHCVYNGIPADMITPGSDLANFLQEAIPLGMDARAKLLNDSDVLHQASEASASKGDTRPLRADEDSPHHFVALVKGRDGHLWELEGDRKGPIDRGLLGDDEDAFSNKALDLGIRRLIKIQSEAGGNLDFSCIALAPSMG